MSKENLLAFDTFFSIDVGDVKRPITYPNVTKTDQ